MKIIYRGDCDELYGQEVEVPDHNCAEHAVEKESRWTETHGLDCGPYENCCETWLECSICHQEVDESELYEVFEIGMSE